MSGHAVISIFCLPGRNVAGSKHSRLSLSAPGHQTTFRYSQLALAVGMHLPRYEDVIIGVRQNQNAAESLGQLKVSAMLQNYFRPDTMCTENNFGMEQNKMWNLV